MASSFLMASTTLMAGQTNAPHIIQRNIPPALESVLCERNAVAEDFVTNGLFDAQIEVLVMKPNGSAVKDVRKDAGQKLAAMAQKRALEMATKSEQLGYSSGTCEGGSAWAVTFPAPYPITVKDGELNIPTQAAKDICSLGSLKVLYVAEKKGRAVAIPLNRHLTAKLPEQRGYIGVMCAPRAFPNSGPREWAIIPVAGASTHTEVSASVVGASYETQLQTWINEKRISELLGPLASDTEFASAAKGLLVGKDIHHDIHALTRAHVALVRSGREPFGENRVAGRSVNELIDLLWMSPAHRSLILNPTADAVGITVSDDSRGLFAVIVVGRKVAGPVATLKAP